MTAPFNLIEELFKQVGKACWWDTRENNNDKEENKYIEREKEAVRACVLAAHDEVCPWCKSHEVPDNQCLERSHILKLDF